MREVAQRVHGLRIVLPSAADRPVTLNRGFMMPAWYDIKELSDRVKVSVLCCWFTLK